MFGALTFFGIPNYLVEWSKILYTGFEACTQNNRHFSRRFNINKGVHQGGPCSSFYFLLCAEIMAILIRKDHNIKGIPVNDILNSLGQYADDEDIFSLFNKKSYTSIFQNLERFRAISGFTLNYDKTSVFRIGSLKNTNAMLLSQTTVSWTNEPVNVLGVWIANDTQTTQNLNYQLLDQKVETIINKWSTRNSSLIGKVQVVNSLVTSLFVYKMMVLPRMTDSLLNSIKSKIVSFLWNGAKPKISYDLLISDKRKGGLSLCDLIAKDKSLKSSWVQILCNDEKLSNIVYKNIMPHLKHLFWSCSMHAKDIYLLCNDPFWKEVMEAWFEFKEKTDNITRESEEILWYNSKIRIQSIYLIYTSSQKILD